MKFIIDKIKLKLLLEEKRDYIKHPTQGVDLLIAAITYIISLFCSDFKPILGVNEYVIETLAWVVAIGIVFYAIFQIWVSRKYKYNHNMLFCDIENLNEVIHAFSIVAIKDTFNEFANRYLLYYDKAWKCWFFFRFKTAESENENFVKQRLSNMLKVNKENVQLKYVSDRLQPKYSERDCIDKIYQHSLYVGSVSQYPEELQKDSFELDGVLFQWWTLDAMEQNKNIMEKNSDVVAFVKEKIG